MFAAFTDIRWRTIQNRIVTLVMLAGISVRFGDGTQVLLAALVIAGFIFAVMLLLFSFGIVGGGDVKLLAAASLLSAPAEVGSQLLLIALAGGAMALLFLFWRHCVQLGCRNPAPTRQEGGLVDQIASSLTAKQQKELPGFQGDGLPYGVAICIGTLANMALSK